MNHSLHAVFGVLGLTAGIACAAAELQVRPRAPGAEPPVASRVFPTIRAAVRAARPGDVIVVHAGVYHEPLRLGSGLTLRAAPGERVVLDGFEPLRAWESQPNGVFATVVPKTVNTLYVGSSPQPLAVWPPPNRPWLRVDAVEAGGRKIRCAALAGRTELKACAAAPGGTFVFAHRRAGNFFVRRPVAKLEIDNGWVVFDEKPPRPLAPGDRFRLCGHPSFISAPGQWAFRNLSGGRRRLFFRPKTRAALASTQYPAVAGAMVTIGHWRTPQHGITLDGLEIRGAGDGLLIRNAENVLVQRCVIHHNRRHGIYVRPGRHVAIRHCRILANGAGIVAASSKNITIEENEVAYDWVDGIVIAGDVSGRGLVHTTAQVVIRRNYIHHHLFLMHPDNIQTYRGVSDLRIEQNLALWAGQGLMTEQTRNAVFRGNVVLGAAAVAVIFGHGNSDDWQIRGNTIGLGGWGALSLTGKGYVLNQNIVYADSLAAAKTSRGDYNLVWPGYRERPFAIAAAPWRAFRTPAEFAAATGHDRHSLRADPRFRHAPRTQAVVSDLERSTRRRLFLRGLDRTRPTRGFHPGDFIEINGDGTARKITGVDRNSIQFTPPLPQRPFRITLVWDWGKQPDFRLDLRPAKDSPVRTRFPPTLRPGARLDPAAWQRGDFNGDGRSDLPPIPPDLAAALPDPNAPPIPFAIP